MTASSAARLAIVSIAIVHQWPALRLATAQELEEICAGDAIAFSLPSFALFDTNDDGALDEREVSECNSLDTLFTRLDLDANDTLTLVEYRAFPEVWMQRQRTFDGAE
jgi:hypothetical protein